MKCDELKAYTCGGWCCDKEAYPKKDVDESIAEMKEIIEKNRSAFYVDLGIVANDCEKLKAENARLKATPEQIMKEVFGKVLIYPNDLVPLDNAYELAVGLKSAKRALWLARANNAKLWAHYWFDVAPSEYIKYDIIGRMEGNEKEFILTTLKTHRTASEWVGVWEIIDKKCRAKAKEYE